MPNFLHLLEAAQWWAKQGYYVFPCIVNGKQPAISGGFHKATRNPDVIENWWQINPNYNIGLSLGASGICALDIDPPLGEATLSGLEMDNALLPDTMTVRTPRGGSHYYFKGVLPPSASKLGPGIDTRGTGSYVVAPPSRINNVPYEFTHDIEVVELPAWIAGKLKDTSQVIVAATGDTDEASSIERATERLKALVEAEDVAVAGEGGDDRTYRLACEMLDLGLSEETGVELTMEIWNPFCDPPWEKDELVRIFYHAGNYRQNEVGAYAIAPSSEAFSAFATPPKLSRFYPRDIKEQENRKPPPWLVPNLFPQGATILIVGASGSYKSFLTLNQTLLLSLEGIETVFVAGEMGIDLETKRVPAWRLAHKAPENIPFYAVDSVPAIKRPQEVIEFIDEVKKRGIRPKLVVLDTLAKATRGMSENDSKDMGEFMEGCDTIKRAFNCSVIAIHHTGKDESRGARGSSLLYADADTVIEVKAHRDTKAAEMWVRKQKDAPESEAPLTFEGRSVGPSLVFFPTDADTHRLLVKSEDMSGPKNVGNSLKKLNAVGEDNAVTTHVLAETLLPVEASRVECRNDDVARLERLLRKQSKGVLEPFTYGRGRGLTWALPG